MLTFQELTKCLPPLRDDEPPALRQQIADEITDHLQYGLHRELLLNGGDEISARQTALSQFGNPQQIARQLWFQAMWSKIMIQRVALFVAMFSMLVSTALAGMVGWMIYRQSQDSSLLMDRIAQLIPQKTESNPTRENWNNLKIKVTLGTEDGPPAEGFSIDVGQTPRIGEVTGNARSTHRAQLKNTGIEECGFVGPGLYQVTVTTPWGEMSTISLTIFPGKDHTEHIVAPSKLPDPINVSLRLDGLPDEISKREVAFLCSFRPSGSRLFGTNRWGIQTWVWANFLNRTNRFQVPVVMFVPGHGVWMTRESSSNYVGDPTQLAKLSKWEPSQFPLDFEVPDHEYSVFFNLFKLSQNVSPQDPTWSENVELSPNQYIYKNPISLTSQPGPQTQWTVTIPDAILKCVKEETLNLPNNSNQGGGFGGMGGGGFF